MKNLFHLLAITAVLAMTGCQSEVDVATTSDSVETTKTSALEADICAKCGCCADCDDCCSEEAEKCSCGFNKGSALCCAKGLTPVDGKYCKSCGHVKGTESCCAPSNEGCTKCGLAKGAPLCCNIKATHEHGEHAPHRNENEKEHDGGEHASAEHGEDSDEHADDDEHEHGGDHHVDGSGS